MSSRHISLVGNSPKVFFHFDITIIFAVIIK